MIDTASLRKTVLSLAARGDLSERLPGDSPVPEDLPEYCPRQDLSLPEIPETWRWCCLKDLFINRDAERVPVSATERKKLDKIYDYYGASGVIDQVDHYLFDEKLLLIGEDGGNLLYRSTPIAFLATGKYWVNNHAHVLQPKGAILAEFAAVWINSISLRPFVTGAAQPKLSQKMMNKIPVPVPPLEEQARIVERTDRIFEVLDRIDRLQRQSALDREELKRRVLEAGVRGHLSTPLRGDSPLPVPDPSVSPTELPFPVPSHWRWYRLSEISQSYSGLTYHPTDVVPEGIPVYRSNNIVNGRIDPTDLIHVRRDCKIQENQYLRPHDIIVCARNGSKALVGKCAVYEGPPREATFGAFMAVIRTPFYRYVYYYLQTHAFRRYFSQDDTKQIHQVTQQILRNALIPLPPREEQERICDRIQTILETLAVG